MGFFQELAQQPRRIVVIGPVAREKLARGHQDLIGRLAPAAASAHAIGDDREHATRGTRMFEHEHLILLVGAVALVEAGGGGESKASCHGAHALGARSGMVGGSLARPYYRAAESPSAPSRHGVMPICCKRGPNFHGAS